jgi:hypothetical protein
MATAAIAEHYRKVEWAKLGIFEDTPAPAPNSHNNPEKGHSNQDSSNNGNKGNNSDDGTNSNNDSDGNGANISRSSANANKTTPSKDVFVRVGPNKQGIGVNNTTRFQQALNAKEVTGKYVSDSPLEGTTAS